MKVYGEPGEPGKGQPLPDAGTSDKYGVHVEFQVEALLKAVKEKDFETTWQSYDDVAYLATTDESEWGADDQALVDSNYNCWGRTDFAILLKKIEQDPRIQPIIGRLKSRPRVA